MKKLAHDQYNDHRKQKYMVQDHIRTMGKHALACGKLEKEFWAKFEEELKGVQNARHEYETSVKIFNNTTVERAKTQSSNLLTRVDHAIRDLPDNAVSRITAAGKTISQTEVKVNDLILKYEEMEKNRKAQIPVQANIIAANVHQKVKAELQQEFAWKAKCNERA